MRKAYRKRTTVTSVSRISASLYFFDTAFLWHFPFRLSVSWQIHSAIHIWSLSQYIVVLYLVVSFYTSIWLDSILILTLQLDHSHFIRFFDSKRIQISILTEALSRRLSEIKTSSNWDQYRQLRYRIPGSDHYTTKEIMAESPYVQWARDKEVTELFVRLANRKEIVSSPPHSESVIRQRDQIRKQSANERSLHWVCRSHNTKKTSRLHTSIS